MTGVTITGADDAVNPEELGKLSAEFPFVEWGVLFSSGRRGEPRYPSLEWISALEQVPGLRLSAHFCGAWARACAEGDGMGLATIEAPGPVASRFRRVQLNGYAGVASGFFRRAATSPFEFILQVRDAARLSDAAAVAEQVARSGGRCSALYDASGGRGVTPERPWPQAPEGLRLGYAGGIRPDTVETVLGQIVDDIDQDPAWIDMESGVRDPLDRMDMGKVREVLERAASFMEIDP